MIDLTDPAEAHANGIREERARIVADLRTLASRLTSRDAEVMGCSNLHNLLAALASRYESGALPVEGLLWVPIGERLPPNDVDEVIVVGREHVERVVRMGNWQWLKGPSAHVKLTHWAHLPVEGK